LKKEKAMELYDSDMSKIYKVDNLLNGMIETSLYDNIRRAIILRPELESQYDNFKNLLREEGVFSKRKSDATNIKGFEKITITNNAASSINAVTDAKKPINYEVKCFNCNRVGHPKRLCPELKQNRDVKKPLRGIEKRDRRRDDRDLEADRKKYHDRYRRTDDGYPKYP
jgi:hypothetical protein